MRISRSMKWFLIFDALVIATAVVFVVQPLLTIPTAKTTTAAADPVLLQGHVRKLSVDFYPRSFDRPANLEATAAYIEAALAATGAVVSRQAVMVDGKRFHNVVARFGPQQGPVMVIGAHYDSHARVRQGGGTRAFLSDTHTPGADDNASGVAGLLELARLLGKEPPARAIELVAYTLEEPPHFRTNHMGSAWHARSLKTAGRKVSLMLSLEMIGYFTDAPGSQQYPLGLMKFVYPAKGNFIALIGRFGDFRAMRKAKTLMAGATGALPVYSMNATPAIQGIDFSDHLNYWKQGYPALMVTDTSFMRSAHYHEAGDTFDKLDYRRMANVVNGVHAIVRGF